MRVPRALYPVALVALAGLAGCGPSDQKAASETPAGASGRVIELTMVDNAYAPKQIQVRKGETVTLRFKNTGTSRHEALVGPEADQVRHDAEMAAATGTTAAGAHGHGNDGGGAGSMPGMDHSGGAMPGMDHGGGDAVKVEPGKTADLTYTFTGATPVVIGCHEPGHWSSGMKANVVVT